MIWGTLMVIPIEESLIYVRPLYLARQGGRIPELTRVIVAYENRIVMEPTLGSGWRGSSAARRRRQRRRKLTRRAPRRRLPGHHLPRPVADASASAQLAAEARAHYDRAVAAQRAGDWAKWRRGDRGVQRTVSLRDEGG